MKFFAKLGIGICLIIFLLYIASLQLMKPENTPPKSENAPPAVMKPENIPPKSENVPPIVMKPENISPKSENVPFTVMKPEHIQSNEARQTMGQSSTCNFPGLQLPSNFSVFAAGAYSGRKIAFQIDQSGHEGTQIDVAVNSPNKPVVLMLGAYEPTIWNIGWSEGTNILAVLVSGYHRQVVSGLGKQIPLLISTYDNRGPCNFFYVAKDKLDSLNPKARLLFGRPVDMVYPAANGYVVIGEPIVPGTKLVTSPDISPEAYRDKSAPLAGPDGLEDALNKGLLRKATAADAEAWSNAVALNSPKRDVPPVAGEGIPKPPRPKMYKAYVVLKPFTYPSGLHGAHSATFFIPKGLPKPKGNPGHSAVYDFNTLSCEGALCGRR